jgi:hypothetical protein
MAFFKNRNSPPRSGDAQKPREPRLACAAFVGINGFEGEAVLSNISAGGFCMESGAYAAFTPGERHVMRIQPEDASNLRPFELEVEVRWIKSAETQFSVGFLITRRPPDRSFEKYMEWIAGSR